MGLLSFRDQKLFFRSRLDLARELEKSWKVKTNQMNKEKLRPIDTRIENLHAQYPVIRNRSGTRTSNRKKWFSKDDEETNAFSRISGSPGAMLAAFVIILFNCEFVM